MRLSASTLVTTALFAATAALFTGCKDKNQNGSVPKPSTPRAAVAEVNRMLSEAEFAYQMKEYARAESLMNQAISIDKNNPALYMRLAQVCVLQNNPTAAKAAVEKAYGPFADAIKEDEKAKGSVLESLMVAADFMFQQKQYGLTENIITQAIDWDKENPTLYMRLAAVHIAQNNKPAAKLAYEKAHKYFQAAAKKSPKDPAIVVDLITVNILLRQPAEAQKVLDQAVKNFPKQEEFKAMQKENYISEMMKDAEVQALAI